MSVERVGTVVKVADGVAEIEGLTHAIMSERIVFDDSDGASLESTISAGNGVDGLVVNLEEDIVKAMILGDTTRVKEGMLVKSTGAVLSIPVSDEMVGRVISVLGEPVDGKGAFAKTQMRPIERIAYGVQDRAPVNVPLHTGIKAIDAMVPIGRGQRELIIGDRYTGKTSIALDTIVNQGNEPKEKAADLHLCGDRTEGIKSGTLGTRTGNSRSDGMVYYSCGWRFRAGGVSIFGAVRRSDNRRIFYAKRQRRTRCV